MIHIKLLCAGRIKEKYYTEAANQYIKRLGAYASVTVTEVKEERIPENASRARIDDALKKESEALKAPRGAFTVALCTEGDELTSGEFAKVLTGANNSMLCFIIGSSNGLHDSVKDAAHLRLSLSRMTLPHSLA
ncbi:MAG: 23S rRNA (pseudouridine(1915)-N(3))-methyltransferase RlmH, partial [Clostridiales bacterium]|nr:23S rRNA (pseudouridine(1915)-N(3))-methyltransferase RlmH [Clostridiales bacterium]